MLFIIYLVSIVVMHLIADSTPEHLKERNKDSKDGLIVTAGVWAFRSWGVYATWNTFAPEHGIAELTYFQCVGMIGIAMMLWPVIQHVKIVDKKN